MNRDVEARIHQFMTGQCTSKQLAEVLDECGDNREQVALLLGIDALLRRELTEWLVSNEALANLKEKLEDSEWDAGLEADLRGDEQEGESSRIHESLSLLSTIKDVPFPRGAPERLLSKLKSGSYPQDEVELLRDEDEVLLLEEERDVWVPTQIVSEDDRARRVENKPRKVVRMPVKRVPLTSEERDVLAAGTKDDEEETP